VDARHVPRLSGGEAMSGEVIARLFVAGRPRTKGSLKPIHIRGGKGRPCRVSLTEDHELATPWKKTMIKAIRAHMAASPRTFALVNIPVEVHAFYRFERTLAVADGVQLMNVIPSHNTAWPASVDIGDEDKLRRNLLDALTQSGLLADDALVVGGANYKRWCNIGEQAGVEFVVRIAPSVNDLLLLESQLCDE
jgi:hypothetical protein